MTDPLVPGQTIGILGGGQLGRMLAMAAARLGFHVHIFEPGAKPPAGEVADVTFTAAYDDHEALTSLSLIHISEPTRQDTRSRMPSCA